MRYLQEPFTGLWNRHGKPMLDGTADVLRDLLRPIGAARPCQEKIGNRESVAGDDLFFVLPPELLARLVDALGHGLAVWLWATDPPPIDAVRCQIEPLVCAGRA